MRSILGVALLVLSGTASAAAKCRLQGPAWLEARWGGATSRAVDARLGETIEIFAIANGTLDGRRVVFSDDGQKGHTSWSANGCGELSVVWQRVEPRMQHEKTPAPNASAKVYANAVVFGPRHGTWIGYDKLEYFESELTTTTEPKLAVTDARPSEESELERDEKLIRLGTMRLKATLTANGVSVETPGASDAPSGQISDRVLRYSFRGGDDFLGWLWSYFNVPYLFGSAGAGARNQTERRIGADCADVLVAALKRAGRSKLQYSSVAGLVASLTRVAGPTELPTRLRFGTGADADVRPGDFLALDYIDSTSLPKSWDHIVALVEDRGAGGVPDGVLGAEDLVADSGDELGLKLAPLSDQGRVRIAVLR